MRDIFYSVLSNYPTISIDFYSVERNLQIIRNKSLLKNPFSCDVIAKMFEREDIMEIIGKIKKADIFYNGCMEANEFSFCVFSLFISIQIFESRINFGERILMMDGTFDVVPMGEFNQLLVIYGKCIYTNIPREILVRILTLVF